MNLRCEQISKAFGTARALHQVSLDLRPGHVSVLAGDNGSGKSTLLRILAGLWRADAGTVFYDQRDLSECLRKPTFRARFGFLGQKLMLYPRLRVSENLAIFSRLYRLQIENSLLQELIVRFGLEDSLEKRVCDCSQGMQRKVALIKTLLHRPRVLLLDEPLVHLDARSQRELRELLLEFAKDEALVFVASHDRSLFEAAGTRYLLSRGEIQDG